MRIYALLSLALTASIACATAQTHAASAGVVTLPPAREIRMALSAAPAELRSGAGVFILERNGFVRVRPTRNGFNCLVERGFNVVAPICYDAEGSRTNLQASLEQARLSALGMSEAQVARIIENEYRVGRLLVPDKPGIAYMLSRDFVKLDPKTGRSKRLFPPHVMIYAPYLRNTDIGVSKRYVRSTSHVWVEGEGRADAYIVVTPRG